MLGGAARRFCSGGKKGIDRDENTDDGRDGIQKLRSDCLLQIPRCSAAVVRFAWGKAQSQAPRQTPHLAFS
ncbi:hypothetical protein TgHK011_000617 [Trichoderma gracile]|nr:hypothetical protein TgHK011_000617 [Trichoderma gracile]